MRSVSNRSCREYEKTIYLINIFSKNHASYGIMWKIWYIQTGHRCQIAEENI